MAPKFNLAKLASREKMRVAGLMSGTSADGVDVALVDIDKQGVHLRAFDMYAYPVFLRKQIFALFQPETSRLDDICHFNFVLGEIFAESVWALCKKSGIKLSTIDLIGSHGQTIYHIPQPRRWGNRKVRSTLQIGEPSVIAQRTGITIVADFRPRDMAAGGQGAPLVPYADYILFRNPKLSRAIQNIGGVANVTWLPARGRIDDIIAFDTGPGNMIIDRIVSLITRGKKSYDDKGKIAASGNVDQNLLKEMLKHPFLRRRPPKTTGHEQFGFQYTDPLYETAIKKKIDPADIVATVTAFTATAIARDYRRFLPQIPDEIILCGGGGKNRTLVNMLQQQLKDANIRLMDELGINSDAKEAISFAILAYATIKGITNNVPTATGAQQPVVLGKIITP